MVSRVCIVWQTEFGNALLTVEDAGPYKGVLQRKQDSAYAHFAFFDLSVDKSFFFLYNALYKLILPHDTYGNQDKKEKDYEKKPVLMDRIDTCYDCTFSLV